MDRDGAPISINRRKSRALVYYLATQSGPLPREQVLDFFWPDHPRKTAQQTLRTTLSDLRKWLGGDLVATPDSLSLSPAAYVDVLQFERTLANPPLEEGALQQVLALYRGPFLSGFNLPEEESFQSWQTASEEYYRRLAIRGYATLGRLSEEKGDYASAIQTLDQALSLNPLQEDLQREILRLYTLAGNRPGAIQRYENLIRLLDEELGVPPMAETRALYDAIINDQIKQPTSPPAPLQPRVHQLRKPQAPSIIPFTGRESELAALAQAASDKNLVLLEGEPGIGKTRLVQEYLRQTHALVLHALARELEHSLPYQPLASALRGLSADPQWPLLQQKIGLDDLWWRQVARLAPTLASGRAFLPEAGEFEEARLWEGVNQFLQALAWQTPVVLFLDDLHWADTATVSLLGYLAGQNHQSEAPLTLITAAHPVSPRSVVGKLISVLERERSLVRITPARLAAAEIRQIAAKLSPGWVEPMSGWLERSSEGNPYVLVELVRWARENGLLTPEGVLNLNALSTGPVVPPSVYTLIAARLSRLSDPARQVLDAAVATGRDFDYQVVIQASALSEDAALDALDELTQAGLVHTRDHASLQYSFDHSLIMEVAWREAGEARHRRFHRRVAEALESLQHNNLEAVAGLIATHFSEGLVPQRAAYYARIAARQAARLAAWDSAAAFYEMALEAQPEYQQELDLRFQLGQVLFQHGDYQKATDTFQRALNLAREKKDQAAIDQAQLGIGNSLIAQTRLAETIQIAGEILETGLAENKMRAEFLWGTALSIEGGDLDEAEKHLRLADQMCSASGDPIMRTRIQFELGSVAAQRGELQTAVEDYRQALDIAQHTDHPEALQWQILALNNLAYHLHLLKDTRAAAFAQQGLALAQKNGILGAQTYLYSTLGEIALAGQDLDASQSYFTQGFTLAQRFSMAERVAGIHAGFGRLALVRGDSAQSLEHFNLALLQADNLGTRRLSIQVRLWMVPLLPSEAALERLEEARALSESGPRLFLPEIERLAKKV